MNKANSGCSQGDPMCNNVYICQQSCCVCEITRDNGGGQEETREAKAEMGGLC